VSVAAARQKVDAAREALASREAEEAALAEAEQIVAQDEAAQAEHARAQEYAKRCASVEADKADYVGVQEEAFTALLAYGVAAKKAKDLRNRILSGIQSASYVASESDVLPQRPPTMQAMLGPISGNTALRNRVKAAGITLPVQTDV
jgi:hypothetical protein